MGYKKSAEKVRSELVKRTEELLKTGREKFEQIDFDPIWKRVKTGLESAVKSLGTGTEKATEKQREKLREDVEEQR